MNHNQTPPKRKVTPSAPPPVPKRTPSGQQKNTQNKTTRPARTQATRPISKASPSQSAPSTAHPKRGISPIVILLIFIALVAVILAFATLSPKNKSTDKQNPPPSQQQGTIIPSPDSGSSDTNTNPPSHTTPPPDIEKPQLTVDSITKTFNSGSYVIYGYPTIEIPDHPEITQNINTKLKELVESDILPMVEQLRLEDTPGYLTSRLYNFSVSAGSGFYSVLVTVDTNEGITAGRSTFCWNFFADSGKYVSLRENCTDRYRLAVAIDGCIENVTSYDQIIHAWLIDILTAEFDSEEFSFYFEGENMIAVLNNNLRLDSFIRDPILITVPYEKISNIFPYQSKE